MSNLMKQKSRRAAARNNFTGEAGALQEDEQRVKLRFINHLTFSSHSGLRALIQTFHRAVHRALLTSAVSEIGHPIHR